MGARDCINKKAASGIVTQDQAKAATDLYDDQLADLRRLNTPNAETAAEQATLDGLERANLAKKKSAIAAMRAQDNIRARIQGTRGDASSAALALLDWDPSGRFTGPNVVQTAHNIENMVFARLEGPLQRFRTRFANADKLPTPAQAVRKATMRDLVKELFGEPTGSQEASTLAGSVSDGFEYLRELANASGFSIPKLENWGAPQTWSRRLLAAIDEPGLRDLAPAAIRARKAQIWADFIAPRLDRQRMVDFSTGAPLSDAKLNKLVTDTYEQVVTGGLSDLKPGTTMGANLSGRRAQSRFLIFKDADSWLEAQERFSGENIWDTITHHVRAMSRDIALMKTLGPNPSASAHYIEKLIANERGQAALETVGGKAARGAANLFGTDFRRNFDLVTGRLDQPDNSTWAAIDETNRNVLQAAMLGGAVFSAVSDRAFTWASASLLGVPQGRVLARFVKMLNPASIEDQALALRVGFGAEDMLGASIAQARYTGELLNPSVTRTLADSVVRASGLVRLTTAGRQAFQLEFLGELTRLRTREFDALPSAMRQGFGFFNITKSDWDDFRSTPVWQDARSGAQFLRPSDMVGAPSGLGAGPLFDRRFEVANKIMSMINAGRDLAIPSGSTRARADALVGSHPGGVMGIFTRNLLTLKSFSLTLLYQHLNLAMNSRLPLMTRAKFTAQLVIGGTILGALGEQMSQISKGRDPLDMETPAFWKAAAARGGGLGILGDFAFSDVNRFGGGITDTFLGPVLGEELPKAARLTLGTAQNLTTEQGRDQISNHFGKQALDFARLMTPGHSLWYSTLAFDRMISDEIQMQLDPNYAESFRRVEDRARNENGQEYFSPPGSGFPPQRPPDLSAAAP